MLRLALCFIVLAAGVTPAAAATGDASAAQHVLARHVAALGGLPHLHALRTYVMRGWYHEDDFRIDTYTAHMRPYYRAIGDPQTALTEVREGYDGSAWEYYPDPGMVVRTVGAAAASARHTAPFDDPLVEPELHGTTIRYSGRSKAGGHDVDVLLVTLADGFEEDVYVDVRSSMIDGYHRIVPMHAFGAKLQTQDLFDDWRLEGGYWFSHLDREVDMTTGKILDDGGVTSVEINPPLALSVFQPPVWEHTPLQRLAEQVFAERDDAVAVLASYRDHRAAGELDAPEAAGVVDFAGYQILKTGQNANAIALLERNVADHPESGRAHFGYARALNAAGRTLEAQAEHGRAATLDPKYGKRSL